MYHSPPAIVPWHLRRLRDRSGAIATTGAIVCLLQIALYWFVNDVQGGEGVPSSRALVWLRFWTLPARLLFFTWLAALLVVVCYRALTHWRWIDCLVLLAAAGATTVFCAVVPFL